MPCRDSRGLPVRVYPARGEHDENVEEAEAVLGGDGQVAAYRAELAGAGEGA